MTPPAAARRDTAAEHTRGNGSAPGVGVWRGIGQNGDMEEVRAGRLLVATPLLGDPNFRRTVVLVLSLIHISEPTRPY